MQQPLIDVALGQGRADGRKVLGDLARRELTRERVVSQQQPMRGAREILADAIQLIGIFGRRARQQDTAGRHTTDDQLPSRDLAHDRSSIRNFPVIIERISLMKPTTKIMRR